MKLDHEEAVQWFRKAAAQGNKDAVQLLKSLGMEEAEPPLQ